MNSHIDIHADDYGLSENSDNDIISLCKEKRLNSISILPNLRTFNKSAGKILELNKELNNQIKIAIHLDVMEGYCTSSTKDVRHLINSKGLFNISWGKLFILNYIPVINRIIRRELEIEIINQTKIVINSGILHNQALRFDSHQHPHMIPVFFDALLNSIKQLADDGYTTEFVRNTYDPLFFYVGTKTFYKNFSIANVLKCLILNQYARRNEKKLKKMNLPLQFMCGVFFSGKMDDRLNKVLPLYFAKASKKNKSVELLFHPGTMLKSELTEEFTKNGFNEFHLSVNRQTEFSTIIHTNFFSDN